MSDNNKYAKFFKARKEDESLIQEIAKLHYSQEALKELISINNNPSAIDILTDKYTKTFAECESLKNQLKYKMVEDCKYVTSYEISFTNPGVTFIFEKNDSDNTNLQYLADCVINKYND